MAKYKEYDYSQGKFIPLSFDKQILPGTFEHTLHYLIDNEIDLSVFDLRYQNDETGAPAYDPRILLKIVLYAYSKGITSSRKIADCCNENVIFMALSADTRPHFTTIADFISSQDQETMKLFLEVLLICDEMGLIGKEMFAADGCKLPSNASKEWSGTKADLQKKKEKMEKAIRQIITRHRERDKAEADPAVLEKEEQYVATLRAKVRKIKTWLSENDDKPGSSRNGPRKSNITDNESATMKTSHGVIQGYNGVAMVDSKHQIVVHAEATGGSETAILKPMVEETRENFKEIGKEEDIFKKTKLTTDSGFHSEKNVEMVIEAGIDAYIADNKFRHRDPRFSTADRHKERFNKETAKRFDRAIIFQPRDFTVSPDKSFCICPAGKRMYKCGSNIIHNGLHAIKYHGTKRDCIPCQVRAKCMKNPDVTVTRQFAHFTGRTEKRDKTFTQKMREKIDTVKGKFEYARRMATVEPVFADIRSSLGLDRFSLRGKKKVGTQWRLYCTVHNMLKVHRYGFGFAES
jgi:transposase